MKAPRLASLKLLVEQLEARDVPAILLTDTSTVTTAQGTPATLTVTVNDDTAGVYHWNYHLQTSTATSPPSPPVTPNPSPGDPPPVTTQQTTTDGGTPSPASSDPGIGQFRILTALGAVTTGTAGASSGWSVFVGDISSAASIVQWSANAPVQLGQSADFWFDTDSEDIADDTVGFNNTGIVLPNVFLTQAPGAATPVDYDAIYNKLIALLSNPPPTLQANIPAPDEASLRVQWSVWSGKFVAELSKIQDLYADTRLYMLLEKMADFGVGRTINDVLVASNAQTLGLAFGSDRQAINEAFQSISSKVQLMFTNQFLSTIPARIIGQNGLLAWWASELAKPTMDFTAAMPCWIEMLESRDYGDRAAAMQQIKDELLSYAVVGRLSDFTELMCQLDLARSDLQNELADLTVGSPEYTSVNNAILNLNRVIDFGDRTLYLYVTRPNTKDPGLPRPTEE